MREHPALRVDLVLDDSPRDLVGEGFDVALRLGALRPSSYLVRRLGSTEEIAVATPGLFPSPALVRRPRDLGGANWVVHAELERRRALQLRSATGQLERVATAVQATANNAEAVRALVLAGKCCALLPRYLVADDIAAGRLVHVCPGWAGRKVWLQALVPSRHAPAAARAFLDALVETVHAVGFLREA
jgi:DNA-binding transcriptional LysR family regulator